MVRPNEAPGWVVRPGGKSGQEGRCGLQFSRRGRSSPRGGQALVRGEPVAYLQTDRRARVRGRQLAGALGRRRGRRDDADHRGGVRPRRGPAALRLQPHRGQPVRPVAADLGDRGPATGTAAAGSRLRTQVVHAVLRAVRRVGRRRPAHPGPARGRPLHHQRPEDLELDGRRGGHRRPDRADRQQRPQTPGPVAVHHRHEEPGHYGAPESRT